MTKAQQKFESSANLDRLVYFWSIYSYSFKVDGINNEPHILLNCFHVHIVHIYNNICQDSTTLLISVWKEGIGGSCGAMMFVATMDLCAVNLSSIVRGKIRSTILNASFIAFEYLSGLRFSWLRHGVLSTLDVVYDEIETWPYKDLLYYLIKKM